MKIFSYNIWIFYVLYAVLLYFIVFILFTLFWVFFILYYLLLQYISQILFSMMFYLFNMPYLNIFLNYSEPLPRSFLKFISYFILSLLFEIVYFCHLCGSCCINKGWLMVYSFCLPLTPRLFMSQLFLHSSICTFCSLLTDAQIAAPAAAAGC